MLYSIEGRTSCEIKIKRSIFICSLEHVTNAAQAKGFISAVSAEHKQATHNCWAYLVGYNGEIEHSSDAGEPSGTAGQPMLNTLKQHALTNIAAVVTRYFGGTKLGIRGLRDAYSQAVEAALENRQLSAQVKTHPFTVTVPYPFNDTFLNLLNGLNARIERTDYSDTATHHLLIEDTYLEETRLLLTEFQQSGRLTFLEGSSG